MKERRHEKKKKKKKKGGGVADSSEHHPTRTAQQKLMSSDTKFSEGRLIQSHTRELKPTLQRKPGDRGGVCVCLGRAGGGGGSGGH